MKYLFCLIFTCSLLSITAATHPLFKKKPDPSGKTELFQYNSLANPAILSSPWNYHEKRNYMAIQGFQGNQSTAINTDFVHAILLNKPIGSQIKNNTFKKLRSTNVYEDEITAELYYAHYSEKNKFLGKHYFFVGYQYRNFRTMLFDKDAFEFVFAGNKQFEADTINIYKTTFNYTGFNQLQIGLNKIYEKNNKSYTIGLGISLLQSPVNINIKAKQSSIYTALDGEYLDIKYNLKINMANQGPPEFFSFKGTGMLVDMSFSYFNPVKNSFRFSIKDIGFIKYTNDIHQYKGDSIVHFEGIAINNIFQYTTPAILTNFKADSLFKILNVASSKKAYSTLLPAVFQANYSHFMLHKNGLITVGIQYKLLPRYKPLFYVKFSYAFKHGFIPSISASFGGYSYYNIGTELSKTFKNGSLTLGTTNLLGVIATNHFTSSSIYLRFAIVL
jgi:Family of unknown function (DUF5723)